MKSNQEGIQRYINIQGELVYVTEEQYRAYVNPHWSERKRNERQSRCFDVNGAHCKKTVMECSHCNWDRTGRTLSLEQFMEDGYEIPVHDDPLETLEYIELHEELRAALKQLEPENLRIIKMLFFDGLTERQTVDKVGLSQKGVNNEKTQLSSSCGII